VLPPEETTVVVNTADDDEFHGLYVSPDPDIITYALAGLVDEERGWGLRDDTFRWLEAMARLGHETWFHIGDRDLATHMHRTLLLRQGKTLSQVTGDIAARLGVRVRLLPMSDDPVRSIVATDAGRLSFQEYLAKRAARDPLRAVEYDGAASARPAPGVLEAISEARGIILAPSNPIASIGPILAIPGLRNALRRARAPKVAVTPIVAGRAFTPPTAEMMAGLGHEVSPLGVARLYRDFLHALLLDEQDAAFADEVRALGMEPVVTDTVMTGLAERKALAQAAFAALGC
jgi:LPPG:FO 2-phospho-L-lactate transferase